MLNQFVPHNLSLQQTTNTNYFFLPIELASHKLAETFCKDAQRNFKHFKLRKKSFLETNGHYKIAC